MKKNVFAVTICLMLLAGCQSPMPMLTPAPTTALTPAPAITPAPTPEPAATLEPASTAKPMFTFDEYPAVDGSTATIPLAATVMSRLCGITYDEAEIYCEHSRTTEAYRNLVDGEVDALLVYEPSQEALEYIAQQKTEILLTPIGRDALVFLVNESNPVTTISHEQIIDVYTGKILRWNELGGENKAIDAFQRNESSGSQTLMKNLVMKDVKMMDAPTEKMPMDMGDLIDVISEYRNEGTALGYSVYYYAKNMYEVPGVRLISVNGVEPTSQTIKSGEYAYVNDFYVAIRKNEPQDSAARKLYDYMLSAEGQKLVEEAGYVSAK